MDILHNSSIYIEDFTPVVNDLKLMPCQTCGMYQYFKLSDIDSCSHSPGEGYGFSSFAFSCTNCYDKFALAQQVVDLQQTITTLNERISSLVNLRNAENSFDKTIMDALTNKFQSFNINDSVPDPAQQVIIQESFKSTLAPSEYTSIWIGDSDTSDGMLSHTELSENISHNSTLKTLSTIYGPGEDQHSDGHFEGTSTISLGDLFTAPNDMTASKLDAPRKVLSTRQDKLGSNLESLVETVIISDSFMSGLSFENCNNIHSANYPSAMIKNVTNAVEHFLHVYDKLKTVVVHTGANDIRYGKKTEEIKQSFQILLERTASVGKKLIISGPVLTDNCSCDYFSRITALNNWLVSWCAENCIDFVNNFETEWKLRGLLNYSGSNLNLNGKIKLQASINDLMNRKGSV